MMTIFKKIIVTFLTECRNRGIYYTLIMNWSHLIGMMRGLFYKLLYFKNITSTVFSLQSKSSIEIFNKHSRVHIGKFVFIRKNASLRIDFNGELTIGDKVFINDQCNINCVNKITIGSYTKIAPNVCINDHDHNYKKSSSEHLVTGEVHIGEHVWIGSNVVILRNTFIGDYSVIAAGSIVKGHVPAHSVFVSKREHSIKAYQSHNKATDVV